jgi:hypothetical protein
VTSLFAVGHLYGYLELHSAIQWNGGSVVVLKADWHTKDGSLNNPLQVADLYGMCVWLNENRKLLFIAKNGRCAINRLNHLYLLNDTILTLLI